MIPRGRPVTNEAGIAARAGVPLPTWRRHDAPAFREHVPTLLPDSRHLLYDLAQTDAYLKSRPTPALPAGELLTAEEAATLLGITTATLRSHTAHGLLSPSTTPHGSRLWPRHEIHDRRDNTPGPGKGDGRRPGEPKAPAKPTPTKTTPASPSPPKPSPPRSPAPPKAASPPSLRNSTATPPAPGNASSPPPQPTAPAAKARPDCEQAYPRQTAPHNQSR